jgi:diadenosine tetraphosphate (Ap4A) HIT family hydrolase
MITCRLCAPSEGVVLQNGFWTLVVNENQGTLGRLFFALNRHETDVTALTPDEQLSLWGFAREAKEALITLFAPDHFNYLFHMNIDPHVHMHIYPRYRTERGFDGDVFPDSRFGDHYDSAEVHRLGEASRENLAALLRHEMTQPSRKASS